MAQYRVLQGIDYPPNKRAEAGQVVSDLPPQAIKWLLESGAIEDASKPAKKVEPVVEAVAEAPVEEPFDPNAEDVDGDGFLQDGTPHQRPVEEK
jgi:hypothetical protein